MVVWGQVTRGFTAEGTEVRTGCTEVFGYTLRTLCAVLIVAQTALHDAPLLTKDAGIQAHYPLAVW